jgi:hypothetical protein
VDKSAEVVEELEDEAVTATTTPMDVDEPKDEHGVTTKAIGDYNVLELKDKGVAARVDKGT